MTFNFPTADEAGPIMLQILRLLAFCGPGAEVTEQDCGCFYVKRTCPTPGCGSEHKHLSRQWLEGVDNDFLKHMGEACWS